MARKRRDIEEVAPAAVEVKYERGRIRHKTKGQERYLKAIETSTITICTGMAGTGKTYCPVGVAAGMLLDARIERIVLTRPLVACGPPIGWLPGMLNEKVSPYMRPMLDALYDFMSPLDIERHIRQGTIEIAPLELMRGASIKDAMMICDESQNIEYGQLRMLLTRFGQNTRLVITGDLEQSDISTRPVPLADVIRRFAADGCHPEISIVTLTEADVVRHPLIGWIEQRLRVK